MKCYGVIKMNELLQHTVCMNESHRLGVGLNKPDGVEKKRLLVSVYIKTKLTYRARNENRGVFWW